MVRAHSLPDMAHFITGASKAVFEHATVCPQEAPTGQQDGDLAASSAHSPPGLCGRCPPPLLQLCQEDLSSFSTFFSCRPCYSWLTSPSFPRRSSSSCSSSYIRHEDFLLLLLRPPPPSRSGDPPLDSETGWTGELWSNCVLLILEN